MILYYRGKWISATLTDQAVQINKIDLGMNFYKTGLGISTDDLDFIHRGNLMLQYVLNVRSKMDDYVKGLTAYNNELNDGNMTVVMHDFNPAPTFGTAPAAANGGLWHFVENRRATYVLNPYFTDEVGENMSLLGPMKSLDTDTYQPEIGVKVGTGVLHLKTDSLPIDIHNLYAAIHGNEMKLITSFKGSKFDYHRVLEVAGQAESVDLQVRGVYQNKEIGNPSVVITVAYKG